MKKFCANLRRMWRAQPLFSVGLALVLLILVQTLVMTFEFKLAFAPEFTFDVTLKNFESFSAWGRNG